MKKLLFLSMLMISSLGFSQDLMLGFETGESGGSPDSFGGMAVPVIEDGTGTNTTKVLKVVGTGSPEVWQGSNLKFTNPVDLTTTKTMTIDVLSSTPITFLVKVNGGVSGAPEAAAEVTHNGNGLWQTLSFTFNTSLDGKAITANGVYKNFVIHTYWTPGNTTFAGVATPARTFYVDNIKGPAGIIAADPAPTTAAPTPPSRDVTSVISLFSDAYTNIAVSEWSAGWDSADITDVSIAGNATKKINFVDFLGVQLAGYTNATAMTHFHMDYWIPSTTNLDGKVLNPKLSNHALEAGETNALLLTNLPSVSGSWVSLDVPLSSFSAQGSGTAFAREKINQFLLSSNLGLVYADNIYLYADVAPAKDASLSDLKVGGTTVSGFASNKVSYTYLVAAGTTVVPQITSATTTNGQATRVITQATAIPGNATVVVTSSDSSTTQTYTVAIVTESAVPTVAAPTPPARDPSNVISLFSNAYANIAISEWSTSWDSAGIEDVNIAGNATKKITYGDFLGVQLADYTNATAMTHFHMDYWIPASTDLVGKVLNPKLSNHAAMAGETNALLLTNLPTEAGSWISLDVPLSAFGAQGGGTAYAREKFYQFLISSNIPVVYVDNIYLHNNTVLSTAKFEKLSVKIYPNPVGNTLNISADASINKVSVYNVLGQEVLSASPKSNATSLQTSALAKGLYIVKTEIDGNVSTSKFLKQ